VIVRAGTIIQCSQGHVCGIVIHDIDTDRDIVVAATYSIDQALAEADVLTGTWTCRDCGELVVRRGSTIEIHTKQHGWIG
jgi:hypothetical protein